MIDLYSNLV